MRAPPTILVVNDDLEIDMPMVNGLEASKSLRELAQRRVREVPLIYISALLDPEHAALCRKAGLVRSFTRPMDIRALLQAPDEAIACWGTAP